MQKSDENIYKKQQVKLFNVTTPTTVTSIIYRREFDYSNKSTIKIIIFHRPSNVNKYFPHLNNFFTFILYFLLFLF